MVLTNRMKMRILILYVIGMFAVCSFAQEKSTMKVLPDMIQEQEATRAILDFYQAYSSAQTITIEDSLMKKYLAKGLVEKVGRVSKSIDANPIIRAQDFSEDFAKTLSVSRLGDNWYMLNYMGDTPVHIPVRVALINGQYVIDYITPEWNGSLYGDSLLCEHPVYPAIDNSNPLAFLQTFYTAYALKYASMPENLAAQLASMRAEHFTSNALSQFKSASDNQILDGKPGYDLLIDDFDFDNLWRSSMKVTLLDDNTYQMSYAKWKTIHPAIVIKLIKQGGRYFIDGISKN